MNKKLHPSTKAKWVKALRSGKYKQTTGRLYDPEENEDGKLAMCCLGVLEHIKGQSLEEFGSIGMPANLPDPKTPKLISSRACPTPVAHELAKMNDKGITFREIAKYINKNL